MNKFDKSCLDSFKDRMFVALGVPISSKNKAFIDAIDKYNACMTKVETAIMKHELRVKKILIDGLKKLVKIELKKKDK